jgi:hypothetical protein
MQSQMVKRLGKNVMITAYLTYNNVFKTIITKLLSYVLKHKELIAILIAIL